MELVELDYETVQRQLEPRVSPQILAMARTANERALILDIQQSANYREYLLELSIETWNLHVRLERAIRPLMVMVRLLKWTAGAASGIGAVLGGLAKFRNHK